MSATETFTIRQAQPVAADVMDFIELIAPTLPIMPPEHLAGVVQAYGNMYQKIGRDRQIWHAYDECDHPVGTVQLVRGPEGGSLHFLRVAPEMQGQGVASQLNTALEDFATLQGFHKLSLEVEAYNTHAVTVYNHWGYRPVDKEIVEAVGEVIIMEKSLFSNKL
jgi:ribosomal protein S18 acetylase RimI-like enzyme